jgi:hypothetical protein
VYCWSGHPEILPNSLSVSIAAIEFLHNYILNQYILYKSPLFWFENLKIQAIYAIRDLGRVSATLPFLDQVKEKKVLIQHNNS